MNRTTLCLAIILVARPAAAQQQLQPQSSAIDRVSYSLGQCVSAAEQKVDEIAELRKQLSLAQAQIATLTAKAKEPEAAKTESEPPK